MVIFSSTRLNWTDGAILGAAGLSVQNCLASMKLWVCYHISCKQKIALSQLGPKIKNLMDLA
ncbi:MAG: hypothetical protein EAZ78_06265 [Oscillatoriales cyanobacterium]|nr:MAG: hypothetical protein EA000_06050 [Oscillatoriales cyanobacterium]TAD92966.1 MAG: hypothetical protein EAZ98_24430 [Oscillatoriales cyanobacterium]TAE02087.1 MAG: hypothetical protein EAZ96_17050 [Oscillatoriales cyanobacterium]TAF05224.1 MAG: hypothetical protein EAZ78_06265 [Oscillatoriales cyanobacterium]TAF43048.1 MAG: hypothetical protein EAZ68_09055 [Oscillatoriales cyanobacterium]